MVSERLHLLPPFRWKLVNVPLGPRPALLGRGPGLRPGLPHPRVGDPAARRRQEAGRDRLADLRAAAGPHPPAVGAVPDPRPPGRQGRAADEGPPRGRRRRQRQRDPVRAARPLARGQGDRPAGAPAHSGERDPAATWRCSPAAPPASRASRCARCKALPNDAAGADRGPGRQRVPGRPRAEQGPVEAARPGRRADRRRRSWRSPSARAPRTSFNGRISAAPPLRVRLAVARHRQGHQERAGHHGQRRRRDALRLGRPRVAAGARRAAARRRSSRWSPCRSARRTRPRRSATASAR